ncbi:MAG: glycosyltransferase, partial [Thermoleophilaceae bacterium]
SPLKFVEALAYGLPVVATSHAAAGLEAARAGEHYREADGPEAFADALAESNYSIEALTRILAPQPALEVAS